MTLPPQSRCTFQPVDAESRFVGTINIKITLSESTCSPIEIHKVGSNVFCYVRKIGLYVCNDVRFKEDMLTGSCIFFLDVDAVIVSFQGATSHHLGQNFSKMFDIVFEDPDPTVQVSSTAGLTRVK